jgi:hypothetical protein
MHAQEEESEPLLGAACRICPCTEAESDSANVGAGDHTPVHLSSTPHVEEVMLFARADWHIWISGERPSGMPYPVNDRVEEEENGRVLMAAVTAYGTPIKKAAVRSALVGGMKVMSNAPYDDRMICACVSKNEPVSARHHECHVLY